MSNIGSLYEILRIPALNIETDTIELSVQIFLWDSVLLSSTNYMLNYFALYPASIYKADMICSSSGAHEDPYDLVMRRAANIKVTIVPDSGDISYLSVWWGIYNVLTSVVILEEIKQTFELYHKLNLIILPYSSQSSIFPFHSSNEIVMFIFGNLHIGYENVPIGNRIAEIKSFGEACVFDTKG